LDKNEEKEREIEIAKLEAITLPIAPEYGKAMKDILESIDKTDANTLLAISKDAMSLFSNKRTLGYIRVLVENLHRIARVSLITFVSTDLLNRKLGLHEQILLILQKQMQRLPTPEDVKKLKELSIRMTELDSLMEKLKKMSDEAEIEKAEAFRKLDKARQQVLKGVV
jgi:hypothetical protein